MLNLIPSFPWFAPVPERKGRDQILPSGITDLLSGRCVRRQSVGEADDGLVQPSDLVRNDIPALVEAQVAAVLLLDVEEVLFLLCKKRYVFNERVIMVQGVTSARGFGFC